MFVIHSLHQPVSVICATLPIALQTMSRWLARGWDVQMEVANPTSEDITTIARAGAVLQHPSARARRDRERPRE
jgi:hypothetical protein